MDQDKGSQPVQPTPIKRTFILRSKTVPERSKGFTINKENVPNYNQISVSRRPNKTIFLIIILIIIATVAGGAVFNQQIKTFFSGNISPISKPTPSPVSTPVPTPTPNPLNRTEWSFEVLNGSGATGLAKKIATQLQSLGYQVVKTGNASKTYDKTEILIKKDVNEKIDLVVADIKDVIKIATISGQLKEGTASARIIIGKDQI